MGTSVLQTILIGFESCKWQEAENPLEKKKAL